MLDYILSPSILSADFAELGEQVRRTEEAGAKWLHIDVMDGHFVPSLSFGFPIVKSLRKRTGQIFDVHLMIDDPMRYIPRFIEDGADRVTFHMEAVEEAEEVIRQVHGLGKPVGVSINPETPLSVLEPVLDQADMVLLMTVHPGFGGQKYIEEMTDKIRTLRERCPKMDIEVDGGIKLSNVETVLQAGANIIVAGSSVFEGDIEANVKAFGERLAGFQEKGKPGCG